MKLGIRVLVFVSLLIVSQSVYSQTFGKAYFRMTTALDEQETSLDVINDGQNNKVKMAATSNVTGQSWEITPIGKTGYYRLTTQWQGKGKALDVINDGKNDQVWLAPTEDVTGQYWMLTDIGDGYYTISNKWQKEKFLTASPDGSVRLLKMGNDLGQSWKIVVSDNFETN